MSQCYVNQKISVHLQVTITFVKEVIFESKIVRCYAQQQIISLPFIYKVELGQYFKMEIGYG